MEMPAFSRRNREKLCSLKNVGFRFCESCNQGKRPTAGKTLHRLRQIMPFVWETVNNLKTIAT